MDPLGQDIIFLSATSENGVPNELVSIFDKKKTLDDSNMYIYILICFQGIWFPTVPMPSPCDSKKRGLTTMEPFTSCALHPTETLHSVFRDYFKALDHMQLRR